MQLRLGFLALLITLGACSPQPAQPAEPVGPAATAKTTPASPKLEEPPAVAPAQPTPQEKSPVSEPTPEPPTRAAEPEAEPISKEAVDQQRRKRTRRLFGKVMEPLSEAARAYDAHEGLDESAWFSRDQEDNREHIDEILDEAITVLGVSEIETTRAQLRELEAEIAELEEQRVADREARVSAPSDEDLNRLKRTFVTSREDYDLRILEADRGIEGRRERIRDLQLEFVRQMNAIGVELDLASAQSLLSTVTGDDFVEMCVVFDNVRGVTLQLQELTEESGESLDAAKRYYGSYVVLIRLMDKIQRDFVRRVGEEMLPQLDKLAQEAQRIIERAQENMARGGDRALGQQNIRSNELTIRATGFYSDYLRHQAGEIQARNEDLQVRMRDAQNTYDTVTLSSEVATLLQEGQRNFAALLELDLPSLRGFENRELREEFERLTSKMNNLQ